MKGTERNIKKAVAQAPELWKDVKADIEQKVLSGTYAAGERVPSVRKIAEDYNIGRTTAQKVLNALWQDGIIEPIRGIGFYVKPYIREQLISERKRNLEKMVMDAMEEATLIGVDLVSMVQAYAGMKQS